MKNILKYINKNSEQFRDFFFISLYLYENINMKKTIRLSESQLNKVIRNAVKYALNEQTSPSPSTQFTLIDFKLVDGGINLIIQDSQNPERPKITVFAKKMDMRTNPYDFVADRIVGDFSGYHNVELRQILEFAKRFSPGGNLYGEFKDLYYKKFSKT